MRIVELTPKGRRLIEKAYAQHEFLMEKDMKQLPRRDRAALVALVKRLGKGSPPTPL